MQLFWFVKEMRLPNIVLQGLSHLHYDRSFILMTFISKEPFFMQWGSYHSEIAHPFLNTSQLDTFQTLKICKWVALANASPWDTNSRLGTLTYKSFSWSHTRIDLLALTINQRSTSSEQEEEHCPGSLSVPFLVPMSEEILPVPPTSQGPPEEKEEAPTILKFKCWTVFRCGVDLSIPWQIFRAIWDRLLEGHHYLSLQVCLLSMWRCSLFFRKAMPTSSSWLS